MSISKSFTELFDKACGLGHKNVSTNGWTVTEHEASSTMTRLDVKATGTFTAFNHDLVKNVKDTTERMSSRLEDKDCDGIALLTDDKKTEHIIFAELKSGFDTNKITDAFHQITMSFVKMHAWLSLCSKYDLNIVKLHFIVACKCFKNEVQYEKVLDLISQARMLSRNTFESKFLWRLLNHGNIKVKLSEIRDINALPFHDDIKNKDMTMYLQLTDNPNDKQTTVNLIV